MTNLLPFLASKAKRAFLAKCQICRTMTIIAWMGSKFRSGPRSRSLINILKTPHSDAINLWGNKATHSRLNHAMTISVTSSWKFIARTSAQETVQMSLSVPQASQPRDSATLLNLPPLILHSNIRKSKPRPWTGDKIAIKAMVFTMN